MNGPEMDRFEEQLRSFRPAKLDPKTRERLQSARLSRVVREPRVVPRESGFPAFAWLRWLVPATGVAVLAAVAVWQVQWRRPSGGAREATPVLAAAQPAPGQELQMDRELVHDYDVVARLPNGEPMRFRYSEYVETVRLRDAKTGAEVQRRIPGVEVIPVGFETY